MGRLYKFMGIDLGTTAIKCIIINETGELLAKSRKTYERISYHKNWMEQRPKDWWEAAIYVIHDCIRQIGTNEIEAVSFSGHMSAPVFLDKDQQVLYNAILIADTRSSLQTRTLSQNYGDRFKSITGNAPIDAFTVSKLLWFQENEPELYQKTTSFLFPKDYIRYQLTGIIGTDCTDAGNSLLYDYFRGDWDQDLITELGLNPDIFPNVSPSTGVCGCVTKEGAQKTGLKYGTPVIMGGADMACSQIGSGAFKENVTAITLSTSIQVIRPVSRLYQGLDNKMTYHQSAEQGKLYTMASIFSGGLSVDWAYKFLFEKQSITNEEYLKIGEDTFRSFHCRKQEKDLLFLPFLTGSGSPYFNPEDRGGWYGFSTATDKIDLLVSVFEGITYNIKDNLDILDAVVGDSEKIYVAGGGSLYKIWPYIIANVLKKPVQVLENKDTSSLGAAILAGVGAKIYSNLEECFDKMNQTETVIEPDAVQLKAYEDAYRRYQKLYKAIQNGRKCL